MRVWEENRSVLTHVGVALLAILAAYFAFISWYSSRTAEIHATYDQLGGKLDAGRRGPHDLAGAKEALVHSNRELEREIEDIKKGVEIEFHEWTEIPPEYSAGPGVYFRLKHQVQAQELDIDCKTANPPVTLSDAYIGFKDIVGKGDLRDREARENLHRLSIVRRLVLLLIKAGVSEIVKITPAPPVWTGPEGYPKFIREYPVSIYVRTKLDPLMRFLHDVRRPGEFFLVVREFDVRALDPYSRKRDGKFVEGDTLLSVVISAAGMRFASDEDRPETSKAAPPRPRGEAPRYKAASEPLGN